MCQNCNPETSFWETASSQEQRPDHEAELLHLVTQILRTIKTILGHMIYKSKIIPRKEKKHWKVQGEMVKNSGRKMIRSSQKSEFNDITSSSYLCFVHSIYWDKDEYISGTQVYFSLEQITVSSDPPMHPVISDL